MLDLGALKLLGYAGAIVWLQVTGGSSYHGISVRPCTEMLCPRPPPPPVGSYWVYSKGKYLAAYNGRILSGQRQLHGVWH